MTHNKEKRYLVYRYNEPYLVDVLVRESGEIELYAVEDDDCFSKPSENYHFFTDLKSAEEYLDSIRPKNLEQIKDYLDYLYECCPEELKEILPDGVCRSWDIGYTSYRAFTYRQWDKIKKALGGRIIVGARSIDPKDVLSVASLKDDRRELLLAEGKRIEVKEDIDRIIIDAMFHHDTAGTYFDH